VRERLDGPPPGESIGKEAMNRTAVCTKCGAVYFVKDGHPICRPKKG